MKKELFKYPQSQAGVVDDFYKEIFYDGEYDKYGAKVEEGDIVVDCGAFVGMFSHFALTKGAHKVYSIEADYSHYKCLVENTKHTNKIQCYHGYVSDKMNTKERYNVERIMTDNTIQRIDYLKIDIEGAEWPLLMNMPLSTLRKVRKWACEMHLDWSTRDTKWEHGRDFDGHKLTKLLRIMERFTKEGWKVAVEHIHREYNIIMLYAWR